MHADDDRTYYQLAKAEAKALYRNIIENERYTCPDLAAFKASIDKAELAARRKFNSHSLPEGPDEEAARAQNLQHLENWYAQRREFYKRRFVECDPPERNVGQWQNPSQGIVEEAMDPIQDRQWSRLSDEQQRLQIAIVAKYKSLGGKAFHVCPNVTDGAVISFPDGARVSFPTANLVLNLQRLGTEGLIEYSAQGGAYIVQPTQNGIAMLDAVQKIEESIDRRIQLKQSPAEETTTPHSAPRAQADPELTRRQAEASLFGNGDRAGLNVTSPLSGGYSKKRGRRANEERRAAISEAIVKQGEAWRDRLSDIFKELHAKDVPLGDFAGMEIDLGEGTKQKVQTWEDLDLAEGNQRRQIKDTLRKYVA